jgi:hypothetical protein
MTLRGLGGIIGYAAFGLIADAAGRRAVFFYNVGAIVFRAMYLGLDTYDFYPYLLPIFGYFVFGVFPVMRFICRSCFQLPTAGMRRFSVNINTEIDGGPRRATEGVKASDDEALDAVLRAGRVEIQQQPRADRPVNLDRQSNDPFRQIAMFKHCLPPWSFVALRRSPCKKLPNPEPAQTLPAGLT